MKILFVGDSPTVSTGFSRCTRAACDALTSHGHEVTVLGMAYYGDPHSFPYEIWPCYAPLDNAKSYGGESRLPSMIARLKPDVVVILQDPWNLKPYFDCIDSVMKECRERDIEFVVPPIVGWLAVDSKNQKGEQLARLSHIMVWTEFARKEFEIAIGELVKDIDKAAARAVGDSNLEAIEYLNKARDSVYSGAIDIVPLGVDTELFYPRDKKESRIELGFDQLGIPLDSFIVGVVGRNQARKRLELTLDYFSEWIHRYNIEDAYLYLHVAPTGDSSCDLKSLVHFFDLRGKVIVHTPDAGVGDEDARMPFVYSAMDVYMTQSQGEGFGLPALEAMACGVECVLPDHSAFGEHGWVIGGCAYKVLCNGVSLTAPQGRNPYTVGAIADKEDILRGLSSLYWSTNRLNVRGIELAKELTWKNTGVMFVESLERFMIGYGEQLKADKVQQVIDFNTLEVPEPVDICITVLNRYDLLRKCLESLVSARRRGNVYVIDNGMNNRKMDECLLDLPFCVTILNARRLGLAESWNLFINNTKSYRIISNDDIEFSKHSIEILANCSADLVFPQGIGYSCFLLRDSCVEKVGTFDETLSPGFAYFEDCDYTNRIQVYCIDRLDDSIAMQDVPNHGIAHLKNGSQKVTYSEAERREYKQRYYIAQENYRAKWNSLPPGLRRMTAEELELETSVTNG